MKAQLIITGQISSTSYIYRKLHNYESEKDLRFNGYALTYSSVKDAQRDLEHLWKRMKEEGDTYSVINNLYRDKGGRPYMVTYDASKVVLEKL
jgi:hypothetical protein